MIKANFLEAESAMENVHSGEGLCKNAQVLDKSAFKSPLRFIYYTEMPAGTSIGEHQHGDDNEVYVILGGTGEYTSNGETVDVKEGDVLVNEPFASHALKNTGKDVMRIFVYEAGNE